ncbi:MAG: class I SAM-dependent methyltransferase [Alphaproteobacteria bacterium]|nr:class I SAM-dependent methyltransferase [Alphaproteobacteria bacterium]
MKKYNHRNFGHIPSYSLKTNFLSFLFGVPNLFKRLQARCIMSAIGVNRQEKILDFGCGSGYLTIEMHRAGAKAFGLDVYKAPTHVALKECYDIEINIVESGERSPYPDNFFDKILASEILPMIPHPRNFLIELKRLLKSSGTLVLVNGFGHPAIEKLYTKKGLLYKLLKKLYREQFPSSYLDYTRLLNKSFGTAQATFLSLQSIEDVLKELNFEIKEIKPSLKESVANKLSLIQFIYYLKNGKAILPSWMFYVWYPILRVITLVTYKNCSNHLIISATKA